MLNAPRPYKDTDTRTLQNSPIATTSSDETLLAQSTITNWELRIGMATSVVSVAFNKAIPVSRAASILFVAVTRSQQLTACACDTQNSC